MKANEEQERTYTVYCHTNKINGKRYVGITSQSPEKRWDNGNGYKRCSLFWRAIQKYDWNNFEHKILHEGLSKEEAEELEIKYIAEWELTNPKRGYNLCEGGRANKPNKETCEKLSVSHRQLYVDNPELRLKVSEKVKKFCKDHPEISEIFKKRMEQYYSTPTVKATLSQMRKQAALKSRRVHPIRCIETNKIYETIQEASDKEHIGCSNIFRVVKGEGDTAGGFHWEYVEDDLRLKAEQFKKDRLKKNKLKGFSSKEIPIMCLETEEVFKNISQAAKKFRLDGRLIRQALNGKCDTVRGIHWEYIDKDRKSKADSVREERKNRRLKTYAPIICIETGEIFISIAEASRVKGINKGALYNCVSGRQSITKGFHWDYVDEERRKKAEVNRKLRRDEKDLNRQKRKAKKRKENKRRVYCMDNNKIYIDAEQASEELNISIRKIKRNCKGETKSTHGFHFSYIFSTEEQSLKDN